MKITTLSFPTKDNKFLNLNLELASGYISDTPTNSLDIPDTEYMAILEECDKQVLFTKEKCLVSPIHSISILFTGNCHGRCKYCYAKKGYNMEYIEIPVLEKTFKKLNIVKGQILEVSLLGGEWLYDYEKYSELYNWLHDNFKITRWGGTTSLFYPDSTFEHLIDDLKQGKITSISVSFDPLNKDGSYDRIYHDKDTGITYKDKELYDFLLKRIKILADNKVNFGLRGTFNGKQQPFAKTCEDLRNIGRSEHLLALEPATTEDGSSCIPEGAIQEFFKEIEDNYIPNIKDLSLTYRPFCSITRYSRLFEAFRYCSPMGSLTIQPNGSLSNCSRFIGDPSWMGFDPQNYTPNKFHKKCVGCPWLNMCGMICHYAQSDDQCTWITWHFVKSLQLFAANKNSDDLQLWLSKVNFLPYATTEDTSDIDKENEKPISEDNNGIS